MSRNYVVTEEDEMKVERLWSHSRMLKLDDDPCGVWYDQDRHPHVVVTRNGEITKGMEESFREIYNSLFLSGSLCKKRSDMWRTLKKNLGLSDEVDYITYASILKRGMLGTSDMVILSKLLDWFYTA